MSKEIKVGILALVAIVIVYFGFNFLKGVDFLSPVKTYYLVYDDINGLTVSNPVVVNGFNVGKVKKIDLLQDGKENKIKVTIEVRDQIEIGDGTNAILKSSDLLGGKMILLKLGPNNTVYSSGSELPSTTEKSIAEELEERAQPVLNNLDTTIVKFRNFIDADDKASFKAIVKNLELTSNTIKLMGYENKKNVNEIAQNIIVLSKSLQETEKKLGPLIDKLNEFGDSLNTLDIDNTLRNLDNAVKNIDSIMVKINEGDGTLGLLLNDKKLYDNLNKTLLNVDSVFTDFERNPNKYLAPLGKNAKQIQKEEEKQQKKKK